MWTLLHGFTGSPSSWSSVVSQARLEGNVCVPTLAGHGQDWQSRAVESFDDEVTRLLTVTAGAGSPRMLCGYSMGARLALGMLVREPSAFDGAVLIGVHPGLSQGVAREERRDLDAARARTIRDRGLPAFVAEWEELPLFSSQRSLPHEVLARQREVRLSHDPEGLARALEVLGLGEMPDYRPAMSSIETRTTLVCGALDARFAGIADSLVRECSEIEAQSIEGVGHNIVLEAPNAVAAILERVHRRSL